MVRTLGAGRLLDPPARLAVQQLATTGQVVGGSTTLLRPVATWGPGRDAAGRSSSDARPDDVTAPSRAPRAGPTP
jgi:hypothetical protein